MLLFLMVMIVFLFIFFIRVLACPLSLFFHLLLLDESPVSQIVLELDLVTYQQTPYINCPHPIFCHKQDLILIQRVNIKHFRPYLNLMDSHVLSFDVHFLVNKADDKVFEIQGIMPLEILVNELVALVGGYLLGDLEGRKGVVTRRGWMVVGYFD